MHLPTLKQWFFGASVYVTAASALVNILPKDSFLDGYPRTKAAYNAAVKFLAGSALNIRKYIPGLDVHIPGLGFAKPADTPTSNVTSSPV
jgi:hypothetical protein